MDLTTAFNVLMQAAVNYHGSRADHEKIATAERVLAQHIQDYLNSPNKEVEQQEG